MGWDVARTRIDKSESERHAQASPSTRLAPPPLELETEDYAADPSTTGVFALDGTATGYLDTFGDVDWFAITVEAGDHIEIRTDGQTTVKFYDAAGQSVTPAFFDVGDFSGPGTGIVYYGFTATTTATYYVAATGGAFRNYTLTATISETTHPLDLSLTPQLTNGVAVTGAFENLRDDWFQVELEAGETIVLPTGSAQVRAYNANGDSVATTQNGQVYFTATLAGTYYLNAWGAPGLSFSLTPHIYFDDYADINPYGAEAHGTIDPINGSANGALEIGGDSDLIDVTLAEQQTVRIVLTPTSGAVLSGLTVELVGPNGTSYYGQVEGAPGTPSVLLFSAPTAGTYTIVVESLSLTATGSYTVQVTPVADDYSHDSSNPGAIVNDVVSGNFETAGDVDQFSFSGVAGQVIRIETQHLANTIYGFTRAPVLYGPDGEVIAPSFISQLGGDVILYRLPEDGEYALEMSGSTRTAAPLHYHYNVAIIPNYAVPDAFYFLEPANFALWTPVLDPGPVPIGPPQNEMSVGLLDSMGWPIPGTLNYTLEEGEVYFLSNSGFTAINTQIHQTPAIGLGGNAFTNHGTVWIENSLYPSMGVAWSFTDFYNTGTIFAQSENSATGTRLQAAVFTNEGDIFAFSTGSYAVGAQLFHTPGGAINAGRIYAVAHTYFASGVQIGEPGGEFYNYGEIYAAGIGGATGISFTWGGTVINEGSIIAEYGGDLPSLNSNGEESHGIHNGQLFPLYVYNSGLIQADIAISSYGTPIHVINDGVIRGDIEANGDEGAGAADTIYNDGTIDGDVFLAEGQDLYDGIGTITGALYLGGGDDAAVGGYGADRFHGGDGNDILDGWLGNDTLYGEAGDDSITGGLGVDRAMYAIASSAASWHRNANGSWTVTSSEGADTVTGVEFLDFTDRDVFLDRAYSTFSGDGTSDLLLRHSSGATGIWFVNGSSVTGSAALGNIDPAWAIEGVADFNGDGRDDIFLRHNNGNMGLWFMNGGAATGAAGIGNVDLTWDVAGLGDLNGDGADDIVWWNDNGSLGVWFMNIGGVSGAAGLGNISQAAWDIEALADFNGDGRDDILLRNTAGDAGIWFMDGGASTGASLGNIATSWAIEGTGDFNGDGRDDILMRDSAGNLGMWLMNGASATGAGLGNVPTSFAVAAIGDYNGDGRDDILWWNDNGSLGAWFMNGASVSGAISYGSVSHDWLINPGG